MKYGKNNLMRAIIFCLVVIVLLTIPAFTGGDEKKHKKTADVDETSLEDLFDINVKSTTKTEVSLRKAPGTIARFTNADFTNYGIQSLEDLYWYIPNLQPFRYKKNNVIAIRGVIERVNNRTQHIIDGIVIRNGYYNHEELDLFIPLEWVESMEVISGPGSSLYGANAFSGVISVNLLDFSEEAEAKMSVQSLMDPMLPIGTFTFRNKNIVFGLSGGSGKITTPQYNIDGSDFSQPDSERYYHAFLKYNFADKGHFYLRHGKMIKPYLHNKENSRFDLIRSPTIAGIELNFGDETEKGQFSIKANYSIMNFSEDGEKDGNIVIEDQNLSFSNLELIYNRILNQVNLLIGVSYINENPGDVGVTPETMLEDPDANLTNIAFFTQGIISFSGKLKLTLGLRYDSFDKFENKLNYRGAFVYDLTDISTVKLMMGTAIRTPSLREWDKDLEYTSYVQPIVNPEQLTTYELSYNKIMGSFYFDITLFNNQFKKMLLQKDTPPTDDDPEGGADEYFYNLDETASMTGVELNLRYKTNKVDMTAGYSYIDTNDGYDSKISYVRSGKYVANVAYKYLKKHRITFGIIGLSGIGSDDANDDKFIDDQPGPFLYLNASLSGELTDKLTYMVGYKNITGKKVYDPYFLSSKFRNIDRLDKKIWISLIYRFNN